MNVPLSILNVDVYNVDISTLTDEYNIEGVASMVKRECIISTPMLPKVGYKTYIINENKIKETYKITEISDSYKRFIMESAEGKARTVFLTKANTWRVLKSKIDVNIIKPPDSSKKKIKKVHPIFQKLDKFFKLMGLS